MKFSRGVAAALAALLLAGLFLAGLFLVKRRNAPAPLATPPITATPAAPKPSAVAPPPATPHTATPAPATTPAPRAAAPLNLYAHTGAGMLSPAVKGIAARVYVPNGLDNTVSVIDPRTFKVLRTFKVDREPQHVVASHDLKTLYVASDKGRQSLTPINPRTGKVGPPIPTPDPYNLYFTPDGKYAMVVAENQAQLNFLSVKTMKPVFSIPVPCKGVNHMDFSPDGQHLLAACEFSGDLLKIDLKARQVTGKLHVGGMPQDVRIAPDGQVYYVADMMANGIYMIDASGPVPRKVAFSPTGKMAHGLYPSRDATRLFISNRGEGSVSVLNFATRKIIAKWRIPGGGSPDMGSVSADGKQLWLSGRYSDVVYVFDTRSGKLLKKITVGNGPHGLTYFPQPGRYSLGHTGNYR